MKAVAEKEVSGIVKDGANGVNGVAENGRRAAPLTRDDLIAAQYGVQARRNSGCGTRRTRLHDGGGRPLRLGTSRNHLTYRLLM